MTSCCQAYPPKGIGPRCSAIGPERRNRQEQQCADDHDRAEQQAAEGEGVVAQGSQTERACSSSCPRKAAIAIGAMIGMKRPNMMTKAAAISHGTASGAGFGLLFRP